MAISNGQLTLREAAGYLGAREGAPNKSGAPVIDKCQALYGLSGVPWCACFVGYAIAESGAAAKYKTSAKGIVSPSTAVMFDAAKRKGFIVGYGEARPGDMFIIRGLHVGFINSLEGGGTFTTIEGNHQDSVANVLRSFKDGWQVIQLPGVGPPAPAAKVDGYGFDDTRVKLYGGWPTPEARNGQMNRYAAANPAHWTQAVRVARTSPYAFRAGPAGTYSRWQYGPWLHAKGKQIRDAEMKQWETAHKGSTARPWRKIVKEA